jgi:hypothetical protein
MADIPQQYTEEIYRQLGMWGTWRPDEPIELGNMGPVDDKLFEPRDKIAHLGIDLEVHEDTSKSDQDYQSKSGIEIKFQAQADTTNLIPGIPQGKAAISIDFSREGGVVSAFKGGRTNRVENQVAVGRALVAKAQSKEFDPDWAVVMAVYEVDSAGIIVSQSKNSNYVATANADFTEGVLDLANVSLGVSAKVTKQLAFHTEGTAGMTPAFRLMRLKKNIWQDISVESLGPSDMENVFEDVTPSS